jgi:hypothetical protein
MEIQCPDCGKEKCSLQQIGQICPCATKTKPIITCAGGVVCHGHGETPTQSAEEKDIRHCSFCNDDGTCEGVAV